MELSFKVISVFFPKETYIKVKICNSLTFLKKGDCLETTQISQDERGVIANQRRSNLNKIPDPRLSALCARARNDTSCQFWKLSRVKTLINSFFVSNKSFSFSKTLPDVYIILRQRGENLTFLSLLTSYLHPQHILLHPYRA